MADNNRHDTDTPGDWGRYADLLRRHGSQEINRGEIIRLNDRLTREWDTRLAARRSARIQRWAIGVPSALVMSVICLFVVLDPFATEPVAPAPVVQEAAEPKATPTKKRPRSRPQLPPMYYDTNLPTGEALDLPSINDSHMIERPTTPTTGAAPVTGDSH